MSTNNDINFMVDTDEKRIKQVLINLQSNALKFTKQGGTIKIIVEYVQPKGLQKRSVKSKEIYEYDFSSSENQSSSYSDDSEAIAFERDHEVKTICEPVEGYAKLVFTVIDTGIGIKKQDRLKLFKLFGTLQNTRQMNT